MRIDHAAEFGAQGLGLGGVDRDAGAAAPLVTSRTSTVRRAPATTAAAARKRGSGRMRPRDASRPPRR